MGEDLGDVGEFGLIERLLAASGSDTRGVQVGPGDDAAVVSVVGDAILTTDMLVEGVHFELGLSSAADVGFKALAVSLSDVAAMGGTARFALVSLGAPAGTMVATLEALYAGIGECATAERVAIVGGDTVSSERLVLSVAVVGEAGDQGVVRRAGAHAGDVVCVTGVLGAAAAGLALLQAAGTDARAAELLERFPGLAEAHRRPTVRLREGREAAWMGAAAMIDLSDGLAADIGHVCDASGIGVELRADAIPLAEGVAETATWLGRDPVDLALGGGEDYELAIAINPEQVPDLVAALEPTRVTPVGELGGPDRVVVVGAGGSRRPLEGLGWNHFREER